MTLLFRVMARNNIMILLPALGVGTGMYLLTDMFERLDNFIDAQVGVAVILTYFLNKIPLIISQILPVVFLLAAVIQLCLMVRAREMTALHAGGVSPLTVLRVMFVCGLIWSAAQLGFSQWLGVSGDAEAQRIWQEQVRKRTMEQSVLRNVWFTEGEWVVSLGTLRPDASGTHLLGYKLGTDGLSIEEVLQAETFIAHPGAWVLHNAVRVQPSRFDRELSAELTVPLRQNVNSFRLVHSGVNPQQLSLWQLDAAIKALYDSGSNVESLRTVWHSKVAYAASLAIMTLVAMAIVSWRDNIYLATGLALVVTFVYYAVFTVTNTFGQQGLLPPFWAAWMANLLAGAFSLLRLAPLMWRR